VGSSLKLRTVTCQFLKDSTFLYLGQCHDFPVTFEKHMEGISYILMFFFFFFFKFLSSQSKRAPVRYSVVIILFLVLKTTQLLDLSTFRCLKARFTSSSKNSG
jgi:hypothetical protein